MSGFRLTAPPALESPAQRLAVLLAQPGRRVRVVEARLLIVTCDDAAAEAEFRQHLPHGIALRRLNGYRLWPTIETLHPHQFFLEIYL